MTGPRRSIIYLALACFAAIGSFSTTLDGAFQIFPDALATQIVAFLFAIVFQSVLVLVPLRIADRVSRPQRIFSIGLIGAALALSTSTSFVSFYSNFVYDEEVARQDFGIRAEARRYVGALRSITEHARQEVVKAENERATKLIREIDSGGQFRNVVNQYLRRIMRDEGAFEGVDPLDVLEGDGVRADFLRDVETQLKTERASLADAIRALDGLTREVDAAQGDPTLLLRLARQARDLEQAGLLARVLNDYSGKQPTLDEGLFRRPERSEMWRGAAGRLGALEPQATSFFLIALIVDLFTIGLSSLSSSSKVPVHVRSGKERKFAPLGMKAALESVYGSGLGSAIDKWRLACRANVSVGVRKFALVDLDGLASSEDINAEKLLRRLGMLRNIRLTTGEEVSAIPAEIAREIRARGEPPV